MKKFVFIVILVIISSKIQAEEISVHVDQMIKKDLSCSTCSDAERSIKVGNAIFPISWELTNNGQTVMKSMSNTNFFTIKNLSKGNYVIKVVDAKKNIASTTFEVSFYETLEGYVLNTSKTCKGQSYGILTLVLTSGQPLNITWTDVNGKVIGKSANRVEKLTAGIYYCKVEDSSGGQVILKGEVCDFQKSLIKTKVTEKSCSVPSEVNFAISEGTPPYSTKFNGILVSTDSNFSRYSEPGEIKYEVTDANGCIENGIITVGENKSGGVISTNVLKGTYCNVCDDGQIEVQTEQFGSPIFWSLVNNKGTTIQNGTSAYKDFTIKNVSRSTYQIVATNNLGCKLVSQWINIQQMFIPTANEKIGSKEDLNFYPNPVKAGGVINTNQTDGIIEILNISGSIVKIIDLASSGGVLIAPEIPGMHILKLKSLTGNQTPVKLIVTR